MGKSENTQCCPNCSEARQAHDLSSRQKENRSGAAGEVGEGEGGEEVGCSEASEPAASLLANHGQPAHASTKAKRKARE
jgi:hypothetical protein